MITTQPVDKRIQRSKARTVQAMCELVAEVPYDKINITMICDRADITRGTFYKYYKNKDEILESELKDNCDFLREQYHAILSGKKIPEAYPLNFIPLMEFVYSKRVFYKTAFSSRLFHSFYEDSLTFLREVLADNEKVFLTSLNLAPEQKDSLFTFISGGIYSLFSRWNESDYEETPAKMSVMLNEVLFAHFCLLLKKHD